MQKEACARTQSLTLTNINTYAQNNTLMHVHTCQRIHKHTHKHTQAPTHTRILTHTRTNHIYSCMQAVTFSTNTQFYFNLLLCSYDFLLNLIQPINLKIIRLAVCTAKMSIKSAVAIKKSTRGLF